MGKFNIFKKIDESLYDAMGKVSHTKISSYIILIGIYTSSLVYLIIDIINASIIWSNGEVYHIPGAHIGLFTLLLGHHLALLGIKKNSENKAIESPNTDTNYRHKDNETLPKEKIDGEEIAEGDIDSGSDYTEEEKL